eukprot:Gb_36651 [translate_table: standard]
MMKILIEHLHLGEEDEAGLNSEGEEEASSDNIKTDKGMTKVWLNLVTIPIKVTEGAFVVIVGNQVILKMCVIRKREICHMKIKTKGIEGIMLEEVEMLTVMMVSMMMYSWQQAPVADKSQVAFGTWTLEQRNI